MNGPEVGFKSVGVCQNRMGRLPRRLGVMLHGEALVVVDVVTLSSSRWNGPSPRPAHDFEATASLLRRDEAGLACVEFRHEVADSGGISLGEGRGKSSVMRTHIRNFRVSQAHWMSL
jgi:hypothetical protein